MLAFGRLRLKPWEYAELQHWQFLMMVKGYTDEKIEGMDKFRRILASIGGGDPKYILPLPGDWDHIPEPGTVDQKRLLKRLGLDKKWLC